MDAIRPIRQVFVEHSLVVFRIALFLVFSPPATWALGQAACWNVAARRPTETLGVRMITHGVIKHLPLLMEMLEFSCVLFEVASVVLVYVFGEFTFYVVVYDLF